MYCVISIKSHEKVSYGPFILHLGDLFLGGPKALFIEIGGHFSSNFHRFGSFSLPTKVFYWSVNGFDRIRVL